MLGVSDDTVRRWVRGPPAARRAGRRPLSTTIRGTDLAALAESLLDEPDREQSRASAVSARNRLGGIVTRVKKDHVMAQVEMACGSHRMVSLMSADAADELGLEPGVRAVASVKPPTSWWRSREATASRGPRGRRPARHAARRRHRRAFLRRALDEDRGVRRLLPAPRLHRPRPGFEEEQDVAIDLTVDSSGNLVRDLTAGDSPDVFAAADPVGLVQVNGVLAGEPTVFAEDRLVIAVPQDNPGDVERVADLDGDEVAVCYINESCGRLAQLALDSAGIEVRQAVGAYSAATIKEVVDGNVEAGLVLASEAADAGDAVETIECHGPATGSLSRPSR